MSAQQSGEKTEKATPKRKRDAKKKGQVFKSTEIVVSFSLIVMFGVLYVYGDSLADNLKEMMISFFTVEIPEVLSASETVGVLGGVVTSFLTIAAPILIAAFLCGVVFNIVQVGINFSGKAISPKAEKISMISGFKRIFSKRTLLDMLKAILKIIILGYVAYSEYKKNMESFPTLMGENLEYGIAAGLGIVLSVAFKLGIAFALFSPLDYMYQRWKHNKDLMMTKQEIRDEYKLTEGNPQTKSRIARKQQQMSRMRMVQAVKEADVVITNPTHYAVALSYKDKTNKAPIVIAKGKDYLAQKIKERARENSIEIVENKPVAQALFFFCEVGDEVPEDLYKAVAEILAYVYRLKNKMGR